jgi:EAL domain-containing protein (putative c-di-GMP-specific phosphodiesterase class I)
LLRLLGQRLGQRGSNRTALLAVALTPADRMLAVARDRQGRAVVAEAARRIAGMLRSGDRYAFASPEEAWVMLADLPSETLAELAGRTLLERLQRPMTLPQASGPATTIRLEPAIGGAWAPSDAGIAPQSMLALASETAASCHGQGASRFRLRRARGTPGGGPSQTQMESELGRALDDNELEVHFQPQLDLRTDRCHSAEALIRWHHADGRMVNPESIVAICEKRDLIGQLTRFTLNTALRHMSDWNAAGIGITVAVNLSAATLSDPSLARLVAQALDTWGVAPAQLTLELTESALIRNQQVAAETMRQLHELGCRLSIDDFGTGYSPYTYLRQFSFDELKIDQVFVRRMNADAADRNIVRSLIALAHTFGMHAVAEGVENRQAQESLRELGCDFTQGWHLSPALAPGDFAAWFMAREAMACP